MYTLVILIVFSQYTGVSSQKIENRHPSKDACEMAMRDYTSSLVMKSSHDPYFTNSRPVTSSVMMAICTPDRK